MSLAERYERTLLERGRRSTERRGQRLVVTDRDRSICETVYELRFATSEQLAAVHWAGRSRQACDRRLLQLFEARFLERLRPRTPTSGGSFPWVYSLGPAGYAVLVESGVVPARSGWRAVRVRDFEFVLHDLQVTDWVLAYAVALGGRMLSWTGEVVARVEPPVRSAVRAALAPGWSPVDLALTQALPLKPDGVVEVALADGREVAVLIELERTRHAERVRRKLDRYDSFLTAWWRASSYGSVAAGPLVLFLCRGDAALSSFLRTADSRVRGRLVAAGREPVFPGRARMLFADDGGLQRGEPSAWRLSADPGDRAARPVALPGLRG